MNLRINFYKNHHYLRKIFGLVIKRVYLQQIYVSIHKINEDGYKNTANIRDGAQ